MSDTTFFDQLGNCYQVDPLSLRYAFLYMTRNHWSDTSHFGDLPESFLSAGYHYSDDDRARNLVKIELDFSYDSERTRTLPAIYVGLGDIMFNRNAMDDFSGNTEDRSGEKFARGASTSVTFRHVAEDPELCLQMGIITAAFYSGSRQQIRESLGLQDFSVMQFSQPKPIDTKGQAEWTSDVSAQIRFSDEWITTQESARIKKIDFIMNKKD